MVQPATRDDLNRLMQLIEQLDKKIGRSLEATSRQFELLQQTLDAALAAIGDEQIASQTDQQSATVVALAEIQDEIKKTNASIRKYLIEAEVDHQKMRRVLENDKSGKRFS